MCIKGGVQLFEFACIKIRWFLSVTHLKWMNTSNFENFLRIYSPWKKIPKFLVKNKLCGRKRDMNLIETCPFAFLSSLVMPRSPRKDFVISWKMEYGPGINFSIFELSQPAQTAKVDKKQLSHNFLADLGTHKGGKSLKTTIFLNCALL